MSRLALFMYVEIDICCLFVLTYIIFKSFNNIERRKNWRYFQQTVCFIAALIVSDLVWALMENHVFPSSPAGSYLVNSIYYIFSISGSFCWFLFAESELGNKRIGTRSFRFFSAVPLLVMILLLIAGYHSDLLFYFSEDGTFQRGSMIILTYILPFLYLTVPCIHASYGSTLKENYVERRLYVNLSHFALFTMFFCSLQILIPGTPLPCMGITVSLLLSYLNLQDTLVSLDPLTRLNNRFQMARYLSGKMNHPDSHSSLFLMIIDLDRFKSINDTFGHVEGDAALVRLSSVLQKTAAAFHCFASRYGGDEFILIHEALSENEIPEIIGFIEETLDESNRTADAGYNLSVSIGCAKYEKTMRYVPEFISRADEALYKVKQEKKQAYTT